MGDARRILDLVVEWRSRATLLRKYGAEAQATAMDACAAELTDAVKDWQDEELTLEQAVEETGYSYSTLQQKVAAGEIPNVGSKGRPRVRRNDLPRKTPTPSLRLESGGARPRGGGARRSGLSTLAAERTEAPYWCHVPIGGGRPSSP